MSPLVSSALLLAFVFAMMKINYELAQKIHTKVEGREGGVLTNLISLCENYNGFVLYFISNSYMLLACFSVNFLYILVQKLILLILTHNPKNSVGNV